MSCGGIRLLSTIHGREGTDGLLAECRAKAFNCLALYVEVRRTSALQSVLSLNLEEREWKQAFPAECPAEAFACLALCIEVGKKKHQFNFAFSECRAEAFVCLAPYTVERGQGDNDSVLSG